MTLSLRHGFFVCWLALVSACGDVASSGVDASISSVPPSDAGAADAADADWTPDPRALVGAWAGRVAGTLGQAEVMARIFESGRFEARSEMGPFYCPLAGRWSIGSRSVQLVGVDECNGSEVTLAAPYSDQRLEGTWRSSSGNRGTFVLEKQ